MTSTSKILKTLYTLVPVLRQTNQRTLRISVALVQLPELFLDLLQEFGIIPSYLSDQSWLFIVPVFVVLCCMAAKRKPYQMCRRKKTSPPTNNDPLMYSQNKLATKAYQRRSSETCWSPIMYTTFSQRRLLRLGHVLRMSDERIRKALLYNGKSNVGRPKLRSKKFASVT